MKLFKGVKIAFPLICLLFISFCNAFAQTQDQEAPDVYEQAEQEADRLQRILGLEDWQVFYVDSTLKHDLPAMMGEYDRLRENKVSNTSLYQIIQDKWMERIDLSYRKIFNDEQWQTYLKSGALRQQKAREKRKAKAEGK